MSEPTRNVDVLVVGFGPAGAAAAIAAHDAGRSVLVLEKTVAGGGNAIYSGGFLFDAPGDDAADHVDALSFGRTPRPVVEAYAEGLHGLADWLRGIGAETVVFDPPPGRLPACFPSWPHFPAGERIAYRVVAGGEGRRGEALWDALARAVTERGIEIAYETTAHRLVRDEDGAVAGLVVTDDGSEREIAAGAVVLACGGFEGDPGLADAYLPLGPTFPVGTPANTGDGLRLAGEAGAALWHMYGFFGWFSFRTPEFASPFAIDFFAPSFLFVDAEGRRFADETGQEVHDRLRALMSYQPHRENRPKLPSYAIFDDAARLAGPLNGLLGTPNDYVWSPDNSAEVERGWIIAATGRHELAEKLGLEPEVLTSTLDAYDAAARAGEDPAFHRATETLVPLTGDTLYAIETWPGVAGTTGGPRHDERARVLDSAGDPIPGLYSAGAVGMVWGFLIDHGGGLTDALVFGRIAGTTAAGR
ncbi:MAG: FAD-binding protein [Actinobacteria bacterium]|nr:FAD-binding protein [Actinomycetota bacterium]